MGASIARQWVRLRGVFKASFFGVLALALYLGLRPSPTAAAYNMTTDFYHAGGLFVLMILSYLSFPRWYWWAHGLLIFGLGAMIEYVQSFHPMRVADWWDLVVNGVGVIAGVLVILFMRWQRKRQR